MPQSGIVRKNDMRQSQDGCGAANRTRSRIVSPEMFPEADMLPQLICSRPSFIGGANDEPDELLKPRSLRAIYGLVPTTRPAAAVALAMWVAVAAWATTETTGRGAGAGLGSGATSGTSSGDGGPEIALGSAPAGSCGFPPSTLNPLAPAASAAAVVAWQVSAALALAPPNSVSEALVAVRAAPQASTSEAAAVVRVRAVRYSSCRGGSLTLAGPLTVEGNAVSPGQGGPTAGDWQTFGSGSFLQGNGTLGFAPGAGQPHTVSDVIADQSGNDRSVADGTDGSWSLLKKSGWALVLGNSGTALPGRCGRRRHAEHCRRWRSRQRHAGARRSINRRVDGRR